MKVALDTNVLVSAFATRGLCADLLHLVISEHQLVLGATVLTEFRRVMRRKLRVPAEIIEEAEEFLRRQSTVIERASTLKIPMLDKTDAAVLAQAVAGNADFLVTGDRDLLDIAAQAPLPIVTPRGLWERLRSA